MILVSDNEGKKENSKDMQYIPDETIAVRQYKNEKYKIMRILKNEESWLTYTYLVLWKNTYESYKFYDIMDNVLDYATDIRKLSNYREISLFNAIKHPEKEIVPIITKAVSSGELNPL